MKYLYAITTAILLCGCATSDPGVSSKFIGAGMMSFRVNQLETKIFSIKAIGAGAHNRDQVQAGFDERAQELCNSSEFTQEAETTPYTYKSQGGGFFFTHNAFQRAGKVVCK